MNHKYSSTLVNSHQKPVFKNKTFAVSSPLDLYGIAFKNAISLLTQRFFFILPCFLFLFLGGLSVYADESSLFLQTENLMKQGRFIEARQKLINYIPSESSKADETKIEAFIAVTRYADPYWYEQDVSLLEKYKTYTIPLIKNIIQESPPSGISQEERLWRNFARMKFIRALQILGDPHGISAIVKALSDKDAGIRFNGVKALGSFKTLETAKILLNYLEEEKLPDYSAGNTQAQIETEMRTRIEAVSAIVQIRDFSLAPQLLEKAGRRTSIDRTDAAIILTGYQSPQFIDAYIKLLSDDNPQLKIMAASALKALGRDDGFPILQELFNNGDISMKHRITDTLSWWRSEDTAAFFIDYLKQESQGKDIGYVPLTVRGKTADLYLTEQAEAQLFLKIMKNLISWKETASPLLLKEIGQNSGSFSYIAIEILGESRYRPAEEVLLQNLDSSDPLLIYYSLWALGRMRSPNAKDKSEKLLTDPLLQKSLASAWYFAKAENGRADSSAPALKALAEKDPINISTALNILYLLRNPQHSSAIADQLTKNLYLLDTLIAVRTLGIIGSRQHLALLQRIASRSGIESYYAAEALYKITGKPVSYGASSLPAGDEASSLQKDQEGSKDTGIYDSIDYSQYILLYLSLFPHRYGELQDTSFGVVVPLRHMGEGGVEEETGSAVPFRSAPGQNPSKAGELYPGERVVIQKFEEDKALVSLKDGRSGWTLTRGLDIVENIISSAADRIAKDFGIDQKEDLVWVLEEDYLKNTAIDIKYTEPEISAAAQLMKASLNTGFALSGVRRHNPKRWNNTISALDTGEKIIKVTSLPGSAAQTYTFNSLGELKGIEGQQD